MMPYLSFRKSSSPKKRNPQQEAGHTTKIDPKLGAPKKTAGVRNLPKIDKAAKRKGEKTRRDSGRGAAGAGGGEADTPQQVQ